MESPVAEVQKNQHSRHVLLSLAVAAGVLMTAGIIEVHASAAPVIPPKPVIGHVMPSFTLKDGSGKQQTLSQYQGRKIALFFFCGCPWCMKCAQQWGQFQRGGALAAPATASPLTIIIFTGDADAAHSFALQAGLDLKQTVVLPDLTMRVTTDLYHADPCPRVFVADAQGRLQYTKDHKYDAPRQALALAIASRALQALRAAVIPVKSAKGVMHSAPLPR